MIPIQVNYGTKQVATLVFLDQGFTHTYCNRRLVKALGIFGVPNVFTRNRSCAFSLAVLSLTEDETIDLHDFLPIEDILVAPNAITAVKDVKSFPHLRDLNFPQVYEATVTLLMGTNVPKLFSMRNVRKGALGQTIAVKLRWNGLY